MTAANLKSILRLRGRTQRELAAPLNLSESMVSRKLNDPGALTLEQLQVLADFLQVKVSDITGETDPEATGRASRRDRATLRDQLLEIDRHSVRLLREFVLGDDHALEGLRRLEDRAVELREEMKGAV